MDTVTEMQLKHLIGYLPYDLRVNISPKIGKGFYHGDTNMIPNEGYVGINITLVDGDKIKPYLRPLSDLTKVIEHEGREFIPMKVLFMVSREDEENFDLFGDIPEYWKDSLKIGPRFWDFHLTSKLFEWHFDVFGLLDKGKALTKSRIKQKLK